MEIRTRMGEPLFLKEPSISQLCGLDSFVVITQLCCCSSRAAVKYFKKWNSMAVPTELHSEKPAGLQEFTEYEKAKRHCAPHSLPHLWISAIMTQVCITAKTVKNVFLTVCASMCVRVCAHVWGQEPTESRQGSRIPWDWTHKRLWTTLHGCWEPNLSPHKGSTFSQQLSPTSSSSKDRFPQPATAVGPQFLVNCGRSYADPTRKDMLCTYSPTGQGARSCGTNFEYRFGDLPQVPQDLGLASWNGWLQSTAVCAFCLILPNGEKE